MSASLRVESDRCQGHGRCYTLAPDLLSADDEGFVAQCGSTVPVPPELIDQARLAADSCPELAVVVEEEGSAS